MKIIKNFEFDPKVVRRTLGLNQLEFWGRIGVAQSAGSRYETGRRMPKPVQELLRVVHIERIDLANVNARELAILDYLKKHEPDTFLRLSNLVENAAPPSAVTGQRPVQLMPTVEHSVDIEACESPEMELVTGWTNQSVDAYAMEAAADPDSSGSRRPLVFK